MRWMLRHWWLEIFGLIGLAGSALAFVWLGKHLPAGAAKDFSLLVGSLFNMGVEHAPAATAKASTAAKSTGTEASSLQTWFASANAMAAASAMAVVRKVIQLFFWWLKVMMFLVIVGGGAAAAYFLGGHGAH